MNWFDYLTGYYLCMNTGKKSRAGVRVVWLIMCTGIRVVRTRAAWYEMTGLRFVFAVWALRRGVENTALRRPVRRAADVTAPAIFWRSFFCCWCWFVFWAWL